MPLYPFRCGSCGTEFEELVGFEETVADCPECASSGAERLIGVTATPRMGGLPVANACPPSDAPPCSPTCCRLP